MFKGIGLRSRLFCSHLLVMIVSLGSYILLNRLIAYRYFSIRLTDLGLSQTQRLPLKDFLIDAFIGAWRISAAWSMLAGAMTAVLLSYWVAKRITNPLIRMKQITQAFAAGDLEARLPRSLIPEINQLNRSFNRMALRLKEVEVKRSELIGDLAHELRTPLTIIRGYLEEWADERIQPNFHSFHQLIREVRRLERLVMDLQLLSRAETGHLPLDIQIVNISRLFQQIEDIFSAQIPENGPQLVFQISGDLEISADLDRTQQILINLVGNALRYTDQGTIQVQATCVDDQVLISVADTGAGISPTDLPHIFDRFWRSDRSRAAHPDGSGLGLSITKRLVELQGGQIQAESQLGKGSTFSVSLPRYQPLFISSHYKAEG